MIGEKIGHFTIKQKLGEGGMGAVYLGEHDVMRRKAAIKVLLPQWTQNPIIVQRFTNEAIAMGALEHPNIVNVTDCGQLPDGSWYIVMEYLDGATLGRFCSSQGGPLTTYQTLHILAQVAAGLEAAHKRGIVHRDLKPENIFLVHTKRNPQFVKILDWGISKLGEDHAGSVTRTGMMAGTPAYVAPEQMKDLRTVDRRSDVYALGVITYQMLTGGWLPFQRKERPDEFASLSLVAMHEVLTTQSPLDPRDHVPALDARVVNAILAAIHPDPARRPQSPRAFVLLLAAAVSGDGFNKTGADIVSDVAPELLEIGNLEETVRAVKASVPGPRTQSRYRLGDKLGAGGMAEVFRATHVGAEGFARVVAVKRVLPGFSTVPQFASMFVQEAKLAALLAHPNIVSVLDFDRDADGHLFLSMEYVDGRDLAGLAASGRLPVSVAIFIVAEMLRGLGYAHDLPTAEGPRGLIHRDVSPQNVLLSWEGAVKVSDFGIAKAREASQATASTMIKGKPQYMSPEQANGEPLDGRSDLFAVGIVLWELLTGRRLFEGSTRESLARIVFGQVPAPSMVCPDLPRDVEAIAMKLLARERADRYPSAEPAIEDLARCADAPRNGRSELARLLAERFPDDFAARASRPPSVPSQQVSSQDRLTVRERTSGGQRKSPPHAAVTRRDASPQPTPIAPWSSNTTLGSVASQSVATGAAVRRRARLILPMVGAGIVAAGTYLGLRELRAESSRSVAEQTPPDVSEAVRPLLTIATDPPGAKVRLDGIDRGPAPVTLAIVRGQSVTIEGKLDGYEPSRQTIRVQEDAQSVLLTLRPVAPVLVDAGAVIAPPPDAARAAPSAKMPSKRPSPKLPKDATHRAGDRDDFNPDDAVE